MDWILYLAALFLVMFSQIKVQGAYARYRQVMTLRGYTGAQVARRISRIVAMSFCEPRS